MTDSGNLSGASKRPRNLSSPEVENDNNSAKRKAEMGAVGKMTRQELLELLGGLMDSKLSNCATKEDIKGLHDEIKSLKMECSELRNEVRTLKHKQKTLEKTINNLEIKSRQNNLVFRGVVTKENEKLEHVIENMCKDVLGVKEVRVKRAYKAGRDALKNGPIVVEFWTETREILVNAHKLKGTGTIVHVDYPPAVRHRRRILGKVIRKLKEIKKDISVNLKGTTMIVQGQRFTWLDDVGLISGGQNGIRLLNHIMQYDLSEFITSISHLNETTMVGTD